MILNKLKSKFDINKNKGFTLIELLVVIAIVSILSTLIMASLSQARAKARDSRRIEDLASIRTAIESYFNDNGYYPQSACGWDCNGYRESFDSSWDVLATDLAPYIKTLPKDPLNASLYPWQGAGYSYAYGNVGRTANLPQYDLTAQLETASPHRCGVRNWKWYFSNISWCTSFGGAYTDQIYEAGP